MEGPIVWNRRESRMLQLTEPLKSLFRESLAKKALDEMGESRIRGRVTKIIEYANCLVLLVKQNRLQKIYLT